MDYKPVKDDEVQVFRGDQVTVLGSQPAKGYNIRKDTQQEGWVPTYVLNLLTSNPQKPAWTFKKFRKPSFSKKEKDSSSTPAASSSSTSSIYANMNEQTVTVYQGETAVLKCNKAMQVRICFKYEEKKPPPIAMSWLTGFISCFRDLPTRPFGGRDPPETSSCQATNIPLRTKIIWDLPSSTSRTVPSKIRASSNVC